MWVCCGLNPLKGFLTLEDVRAFLSQHVSNFNYDCDLIRRYDSSFHHHHPPHDAPSPPAL